MALYCNRFIILFTLITHNKTKNIFNLTAQFLESTVVLAHRDWHQVGRQEELLTGGGTGDGRWLSWRVVSNSRCRASCSFTHTWCYWNEHLHLWKFATWRFICRGLTVFTVGDPHISNITRHENFVCRHLPFCNFLSVIFQEPLLLLLLSRFSRVQLCVTSWTAAHQAPLSLGFSRQEYWSGLPFPSPMHACMLSRFSRVRLCAILWTEAHEASLSTGFSKQEYWSGLPCPSPPGTTGCPQVHPAPFFEN